MRIVVMKVICVTVNAFVFCWVSLTLFQCMISGTQRACFISSAIPRPVVKSGAFKTSGGNQIVLNVTDKPAEFDFVVH